MALATRQEFTFHTYIDPTNETVQLRQIGNCRPPNELIQKAKQLAFEKYEEYKSELDETTYLGKIQTAFAHVPGEPEKNEIVHSFTEFKPLLKQNTRNRVGDPVTGEYQARTFTDKKDDYHPYQDKGWLTLNGEYYSPSDSKPDGWSSR